MRDPFPKYTNLSYRSIIWDLRGAGMPERVIEQTIEGIKEYRRVRAINNAKRREAEKQWGEIITALQHERKIVRSMVRYETKDPAPERQEFITNYFEVLNKLYDKLDAKRKRASELPPHDHWVDYVPEHIKQALLDAAYNVPRRDKAKIKAPFERRLPPALHDLKKGRLQRATRKQLSTVLDKLKREPDNEELKLQAEAMQIALKKINALEMGEDVPNTWHAVNTDDKN